MPLLRLLVLFFGCEAFLILRLIPGRWFYLSLLALLVVKYLLLQYVPVYGGYALLFHAAMAMAAFHLGTYLLVRLSPFGRMVALRGIVNPSQKGRLVAQFFLFSRKTALLRLEPALVTAFAAFCYLTPIVRAVWLPWYLPITPAGFVYDEQFYRLMLVIGQVLPLLLAAGVYLHDRLEWRGSIDVFQESVRAPLPSAAAPPAELTFPVLGSQSTKAGPRSPSVAELARRFEAG